LGTPPWSMFLKKESLTFFFHRNIFISFEYYITVNSFFQRKPKLIKQKAKLGASLFFDGFLVFLFKASNNYSINLPGIIGKFINVFYMADDIFFFFQNVSIP